MQTSLSTSTIVFARTPADLQPSKGPLTLKAAADAFLVLHANRRSQSYRKWLEQKLSSLVTFLGPDLEVDQVTIWQLDLWYATLATRGNRYTDHPYRRPVEGGLSARTLHGYVRAVRVFFNWLGARRYIQANPASLLEFPEVPEEPPKHADRSEVVALLNHFESAGMRRNYAAVRLLVATGLRAGGLVGLRKRDVSESERILTVREKGRGGQNKGRAVVVDADTLAVLTDYMRSHSGSWVFVVEGKSRPDGKWSTGGLYQALKRASRRLGFQRVVGPHMLRHYFGFESVRRGLTIRVVQQLMGHASSSTTEIYTKFRPYELREAYDDIYGDSSDPRGGV